MANPQAHGGKLDAGIVTDNGQVLVGTKTTQNLKPSGQLDVLDVTALPAGTAGQVLTADPTAAPGVKWAAPSGGSSSAPTIVAGGNLGATRSQSVATNTETWLTGTLNANHTLTLTLGVGARLRLFGAQDATGGRTLTVSDGTTSQSVTIPSAAAAGFEVDFYSPDGTTIYVNTGGGPQGPAGATGATGAAGATGATGATGASGATTITANTQTGSYTLVLADAGKRIRMNSASATVVTIPPNSSVALPVDTVIELARVGAGTVTITPGAGVTIPNRLEAAGTTSRTISSQWSAVSIIKDSTDAWNLVGDIT